MGETFTGESGVPRSERVSVSRQIEFNATEHCHFDYGYAVTIHSSQGLTAERILAHADTSVHPGLHNSRFAYVSNRARQLSGHPIHRRRGKTRPHLGADASKTQPWKSIKLHPPIGGLGQASPSVNQLRIGYPLGFGVEIEAKPKELAPLVQSKDEG